MIKLNNKTLVGSLLGIPLAIIFGWWALFEYGVTYIENRVEEAGHSLQRKGYDVSYDSFEMSGTPFRIYGTFKNLKLRKDNNLYQLESPQLKLSIKPWRFRDIHFVLDGGSHLSIPALSNVDWSDVTMERCRGILSLNDKNKAQELRFFTSRITPHLSGSPLDIALDEVVGDFTGIDDVLTSAGQLSFKVTGLADWLQEKGFKFPLTFEATYAFGGVKKGTLYKGLEDWHREGGYLDLQAFSLNWGTAKINGSGKVSVDETLRPAGTLHASIVGYEMGLDVLVERGHIKKKNAGAVKFALNLIAGQPELGEKTIQVPLTLQKGYLRVGPAKLIKLQPLE